MHESVIGFKTVEQRVEKSSDLHFSRNRFTNGSVLLSLPVFKRKIPPFPGVNSGKETGLICPSFN